MKTISFIILFLISTTCFCQLDSSKIKTSGIVLKGRDCDMILYLIKYETYSYPQLDSVLKVKYANPPGDNQDVTIDSVPARQFLRLALKAKYNNVCLVEGMFNRIDAELRLHGTAWLINKLNRDKTGSDATYDALKKEGQKYGKKQDEDFN